MRNVTRRIFPPIFSGWARDYAQQSLRKYVKLHEGYKSPFKHSRTMVQGTLMLQHQLNKSDRPFQYDSDVMIHNIL